LTLSNTGCRLTIRCGRGIVICLGGDSGGTQHGSKVARRKRAGVPQLRLVKEDEALSQFGDRKTSSSSFFVYLISPEAVWGTFQKQTQLCYLWSEMMTGVESVWSAASSANSYGGAV
jgi:hypothetical protein